MNPNKCAFGVSAGEFLRFLVHEGGIEVGKKSMKAIDEVVPPTNLKELQSLLGKINFVKRFISNLSQKVVGGIRNPAFRTPKIKECFSRSDSRAKGPAAKPQKPLNLFLFFRSRLSS
jgi:hypothetical protein